MKRVTVLSIVFGAVILFASATLGQFATQSRGNPPKKQEVERSPHAEASGKSSPDERFNVTHSEVTPDLRAAGAAEKEESTGEEKIEWGKETRGLVANLRALKTVVKSGEPIEFEIRVKNVSNKDVYLPSGRADEKMSPCFWTFCFDQWEWRSAQLAARNVPLKPGETASVRCLVATTRDSMTAEQKEGRFFHGPFRHMENKKESDRLPEGSYRVRAIHGTLDDGIKSNTIEVRIIDGR
jgi:hypothetical protein